MATISITIKSEANQDFNDMAQERGFPNGRAMMVDWAWRELAHWLAVRAASEGTQTEMQKLDGEIV